MPGERELPIAVRGYRGVMLAVDPAFIGAEYLQRANNWVPNLTRVLAKRRGTASFQTFALDPIDRMLAVVAADGTRYLYAVGKAAGTDELHVSVNDGVPALVTSGAFAGSNQRYGMTVLGQTLYVGNPVDPVKSVPLGGAATDLTALALANDTGQAAVATADATASLLGGTYSYRWAVYDTNLKKWTSIGPVRTINLTGGSWFRIDVTAPQAIAPATVLGPNERWHLFVAGCDQEIEGAHDQFPAGLAAAATCSLLAVTADGTVVPTPSTVVRKGRYLVTHRGRVWLAGDAANPRRVTATNVLQPGLEQAIYDQGLFYPANAYVDVPAAVTGLAVASLTSTDVLPTAPIAIFTAASTWLWFGDVRGDPTASREQISDEVGCVSDRTIVSTPLGAMFLGQRSVYLLPADLAEPVDIGWPIEPAIRAQPIAARGASLALYHKGFYCLGLAEPGGLTPTAWWFLDLRRGIGDPPAWWGPHRHPALTATARMTAHPSEDDRAWGAVAGGAVLLLQQDGSYQDDGTTITSDLRTGYLDGGKPLQPKLAKRVRVLGDIGATTDLGVSVRVAVEDADPDSGIALPGASTGLITLQGPSSAAWDSADWDSADWGAARISRGTFITDVPELRGLAFELSLTHADATACELRDVEVRVAPIPREED